MLHKRNTLVFSRTRLLLLLMRTLLSEQQPPLSRFLLTLVINLKEKSDFAGIILYKKCLAVRGQIETLFSLWLPAGIYGEILSHLVSFSYFYLPLDGCFNAYIPAIDMLAFSQQPLTVL